MTVLRTRNKNRHIVVGNVFVMFSKITTRLRNLSVYWLFVSVNYSLRIAQREPLVGQGPSDGSSQWKLSRACLASTTYVIQQTAILHVNCLLGVLLLETQS